MHSQWQRLVSLRRIGWLLTLGGSGTLAGFVTLQGWLGRHDSTRFGQITSWANILSLTVAVAGFVVTLLDRSRATRKRSSDDLRQVATALAAEVRYQVGKQRAELLETDRLDSHYAHTRFTVLASARKSKRSHNRKKPPQRELRHLSDFYLRESRGRLVILGKSGTGKSVLAVNLAIDLLKDARALAEQQSPVPVILSLSSWSPAKKDARQWIAERLAERFQLDIHTSLRLVRDGWILPILDDLDEMDSADAAPKRAGLAVRKLNELIATVVDCRFVVICRSDERRFAALANKISADVIQVEELDADAIRNYIEDQCENEGDRADWEPFLNALKGPTSSHVVAIFGRLWYLTSAITCSRWGEDPATFVPAGDERDELNISKVHNRSKYSYRVRTKLLSSFIAARVCSRPRRISSSTSSIVHLIHFARFVSHAERNGSGNEFILHNWWESASDGFQKTVVRAHLVTTFIALHIPWIIVGLFHFGYSTGNINDWDFIVYAVNYSTIGYFSLAHASRLRNPVKIHLNVLSTPLGLFASATAWCFAAIIGWISALVYGNLTGVLTGLILAALMPLMLASSKPSAVQQVHPADALVNDRNYRILIGCCAGGLFYMYYLWVFEGNITVPTVFAGMAFVGAFCSSVYVRYLVAVFCGRLLLGLPIRLNAFLDWSRSVGLMRASSIGYQFRHQELQRHLSANTLSRDGSVRVHDKS